MFSSIQDTFVLITVYLFSSIWRSITSREENFVPKIYHPIFVTIITSFCLWVSYHPFAVYLRIVIIRVLHWLGTYKDEEVAIRVVDSMSGTSIVLRIMSVVVIYFLVLSVLTIGVIQSDHERAMFHHGWWTIKVLFIVGGWILSLCFVSEELLFIFFERSILLLGIAWIPIATFEFYKMFKEGEKLARIADEWDQHLDIGMTSSRENQTRYTFRAIYSLLCVILAALTLLMLQGVFLITLQKIRSGGLSGWMTLAAPFCPVLLLTIYFLSNAFLFSKNKAAVNNTDEDTASLNSTKVIECLQISFLYFIVVYHLWFMNVIENIRAAGGSTTHVFSVMVALVVSQMAVYFLTIRNTVIVTSPTNNNSNHLVSRYDYGIYNFYQALIVAYLCQHVNDWSSTYILYQHLNPDGDGDGDENVEVSVRYRFSIFVMFIRWIVILVVLIAVAGSRLLSYSSKLKTQSSLPEGFTRIEYDTDDNPIEE